MKALWKESAGRGLVLKETPIPQINDDEALVKVNVASICGTDLHIYIWNDWAKGRIKPPIISGHEFAGTVVEVGKSVKRIKKGDFVSAETHISCGHCFQCLIGHPEICENLKILGVDINGAFAEYVAIPEKVLWVNPPTIKEDFASIQEPLGNAVDTVLAEDVSGKTVLITGAGPIGLLGVGVARVFGATKIIVSDLSDYHLDIARKMGADIVVNAKSTDIKQVVLDETNGHGVDVGLEFSGSEIAFRDLLKSVRAGGRVSLLGLFNNSSVSVNLNDDVIFKKIRIYGITGRRIFETWNIVSNLLSSGRLDVAPVITHKFPLEEFDKGMELMEHQMSGKVLLIP
ncbi:MAG: L-threonine 3-dehydrogenase [Caldisericaceae bacterium]